jgi:hypothetical protein
MQFSPRPIVFSPGLKYPPQNLQSVFLPLSERPCFAPIQNNRQNYRFVIFNLKNWSIWRNDVLRKTFLKTNTNFTNSSYLKLIGLYS